MSLVDIVVYTYRRNTTQLSCVCLQTYHLVPVNEPSHCHSFLATALVVVVVAAAAVGADVILF